MQQIKRFIKALAIIVPLVILVNQPSWATDWTYLGIQANGDPIYFDKDTIQWSYNNGSETVSVWTKMVYKSPQKAIENGKLFSVRMSLVSIVPSERKAYILSYAYYTRSGQYISGGDFNTPRPSSIVPESLGEVLMNALLQLRAM